MTADPSDIGEIKLDLGDEELLTLEPESFLGIRWIPDDQCLRVDYMLPDADGGGPSDDFDFVEDPDDQVRLLQWAIQVMALPEWGPRILEA
jgi:hypothetical protein